MEHRVNDPKPDKASTESLRDKILVPALNTAVTSAFTGAGALFTISLEAWKEGATPQQRLAVPFALVTVISGLLLVVVILWWRKKSHPKSPKRLHWVSLPAIATLMGVGLALLMPAWAPADTSKANIVLLCPDRTVTAASIDGIDLGTPLRDGARLRFAAKLSLVPERVFVEVTRPQEGSRWSQKVEAKCSRDPNQVRCAISDLDWSPERFISGTYRSGMINDRRVLRYGSDNSCRSLAGQSLYEGKEIFKATERRIKVEDRSDGISLKPGDSHVALVSPYSTDETSLLLDECERLGALGCGPMLSVSSGVGLREKKWAQATLWDTSDATRQRVPSFFRLTSTNESRARTTAALVEQRSRKGTSIPTVTVVYHDGRQGYSRGDVHYALDQAKELGTALKDYPAVRWISFTHGQQEGPTRLSFSTGAPSDPPRPLPFTSFNALVAHLVRNPGVRQIVLFIDRDQPLVELAQAVHLQRGLIAKAKKEFEWIVPGPREVFDGVWANRCFGHPHTPAHLKGFVSISSVETRDTVQAWAFEEQWHKRNPREPVSSRAARTYDALSMIEAAVKAVDQRLTVTKRHVDVAVYRDELRKEIARLTYAGANATYKFDQYGDMTGDNSVLVHSGERGFMLLSADVPRAHRPRAPVDVHPR